MIRYMSRRFKPAKDRVMVVPNKIRGKGDEDFIWKILALEGRDTGGVVGLATEVALIGPVGCIPTQKGITGHIAGEPIWMTNATHQADGAWQRSIVMDAAILTSDGEVWTVNHTRTPEARVRNPDKDFRAADFPRRWINEVQVVSG